MARENESQQYAATFQQIAKECNFATPTQARKFVDKTLTKMKREMTRRGVYDSRLPGIENLWDQIDNS